MHTNMINPQEVEEAATYFDATSVGYDAEFSDSSIWSIAHRTGRTLLEQALDERTGLDIADIGCGTGKWAGFFSGRASSLLLSDVAESMLAVAVRKFAHVPSVQSLRASVDDLGHISDASFDLVLCMGDPLSYAPDYVRGISELCRITRPGGLIFVSVDSRLGYLRILKEQHHADLDTLFTFLETGNIIGWEGLPLHAFTTKELGDLFAEAGAETLSIHSLPSASAYFLFDDRFREQIHDPRQFERLIAMEDLLRDQGSPGPHHLYGLFKKALPGG
ncbi:Ubiquinone/menaquinone biosynthesis C-methylase UbiE [Thiomonas bhubaneswarensis]|uniref:Ubiquinone/menaquinone biosynthesis C-methylase UbiE n=2 Tax=Thiomonas bhubaneswarensis TaxID=339866 RepID=A0A0K6I073_9BURK|nr:Ubiquinone/menaquinone biosynthesis C-methylase UbiE [Thiomonas bhubaneswarensis]